GSRGKRQELAQPEGVAAGESAQRSERLRIQRSSEAVFGQPGDLVGGEGRQGERLAAGAALRIRQEPASSGVPCEIRRAEGCDDQDRQCREEVRKEAEEGQAREIGPVEVVEEEEHRAPTRR